MTTRTWLGGGDNSASNPNDWSPAGAPEPGDTLQISNPGPATMNVQDNALAGDPLLIAADGTTVNLSDNAVANVVLGQGASPTINIAGVAHFAILPGEESGATVNLAANSAWIGGFSFTYSESLTVNGPRAVFINDEASSFGSHSGGGFNTAIAGTGSISGYGNPLEFGGFVSRGQTITEAGPGAIITVDHPSEYHALTDLLSFTELDLVGLANADSYTLKNDLLRLYSGNHVIYTARLEVSPPVSPEYQQLAVMQTATGVDIYTDVGIVPGLPSGGLPVHQG